MNHVVAAAAEEQVGTLLADQNVVPISTREQITLTRIARTLAQAGVAPHVPEQAIGTALAEQHVASLSAFDPIIAIAGVHVVDTACSEDVLWIARGIWWFGLVQVEHNA